jgi:hypothetical protein
MRALPQKPRRGLRSVFRRRSARHNPLLLSSLLFFNDTPPRLKLEFPGGRHGTWTLRASRP